VSDKKQVPLSTELAGAGRLYPWATIDALPDNVLLETFEFYLGKEDADEIDYGHHYDGWQMLVHMCCKLGCIVFASPRRLDLKLYCTQKRSGNSKALDIWPALPVVIFATDMIVSVANMTIGNAGQISSIFELPDHTKSKEYVTNVITALRHHSRVCKIYYRNGNFQDCLLKEFAATDEPFPALTSLELSSF